MNEPTAHALGSTRSTWRELALASLVGLAAMSLLGFLVEIAQPPEIPLTIWITPIFALVAMLTAVTLPLLYWDNAAGYGMAAVTGIVAIVGMAAYYLELLGPARGAPAGVLYALLGLVILGTTVVAWRERSAERTTTAGATTSQ